MSHLPPQPNGIMLPRSFVEHVVKGPKADEAAQATAHFKSKLAGNPNPNSNPNPSTNSNPDPRERLIFEQADEATHTIPSLPPCGVVWL